MPTLITFRHSATGTVPLLFISEEIYTPRQLRKPLKRVRNQEPHVEQLLLHFLPAAHLRCWCECFNLDQAKKSSTGQHQRPQCRHSGVMRDGTQPLCALLVSTAVLSAAELRRDVQLWTCLQGWNPQQHAENVHGVRLQSPRQAGERVHFSHGQNRLAWVKLGRYCLQENRQDGDGGRWKVQYSWQQRLLWGRVTCWPSLRCF